jgi:homocysteine S-methyltransferase
VPHSTLSRALAERPVLLDGGLSTQLEAQGEDLSGGLWSARLLRDNPDAIVAAHRAFFAAGAQVATTASYQASYDGFASAGLDAGQTDVLLQRSVVLARDAAQTFDDSVSRWVAASVGPYGAMHADGSEYRGQYGRSVAQLRAFHRRRMEVLVAAQPDVLAIETIPELAEVEAVITELDLLQFPAWISVSVAAGRVCGGASLVETFALAAASPWVIAVGLNCSPPQEVVGAVRAAAASGRPALAYPNSGETWDAVTRTWRGTPGLDPLWVDDWLEAGARLVGGCCRVRPTDIAAIADRLTAKAAG